jgi:hypothetical protein
MINTFSKKLAKPETPDENRFRNKGFAPAVYTIMQDSKPVADLRRL